MERLKLIESFVEKFVFVCLCLIVYSCGLSMDLEKYRAVIAPTDTPTIGSGWRLAVSNVPFGGRYSQSSAVLNGTVWMAGGVGTVFKNDVWFSTDGSGWYCATTNAGFAPRYDFAMATFSNALWLVGGKGDSNDFFSDVWRSADGTNWDLVTAEGEFDRRSRHTLLAFNGMLWLIGGIQTNGAMLNDVWFSGNGSNWYLASSNAFSYYKLNHSCVVFDNKMWVIGGYFSGNEVCWSQDGTNWSSVLAPFVPRYSAGVTVYNGKIWLAGGGFPPLGIEMTNDVWSSVDGTNWAPEETLAAFGPRCKFSMITCNNSILIITGDSTNGSCDDVWYYR